MTNSEQDQFLAAWLAGRQDTIAAVLEALPAGMAPATQAANVHAALLAEAGMPDATAATEWAIHYPASDGQLGDVFPTDEERARSWVRRSASAPAGAQAAGAELVSRVVVTSAWQRADGEPLAEVGQPPAALRTQWAVQLPGHPFGLRIAGGEAEAREALADQRAGHRPGDGPAPELVRRLVGDWQPVAGEG